MCMLGHGAAASGVERKRASKSLVLRWPSVHNRLSGSSAPPRRPARAQSGFFNAAGSTGILRKRLPVAAKIALATAGTSLTSRTRPCRPAARALDDVDLDGRRFVHAQHLVAVEIALLDAAVLERDFAVQRRRDAEDDRALDLRLARCRD